MNTKKLIISIAILSAVSSNLMAIKRYVDIKRSGGFFGGYWAVTQTYNGIDSQGNQYWSLDCHNPGFNGCKLHASGGSYTVPARQAEIDRFSDGYLEEMITKSNESAMAGTRTGKLSSKYLTTLSDGSKVLIAVTLSWKPDPASPADYIMAAEITDTEAI